MPQFTDETIEKIFGADEAEGESDERFLQYFYYNQAYASVRSDLSIRVLVGHKGVGKSAVIKRAFLADKEENKTAVLLKAQTVSGYQETRDSNGNLIALGETWKKTLLYAVIERLLAEEYSAEQEVALSEIKNGSVMAHVSLLRKILASQGYPELIRIYIDDIDRSWNASADSIHGISAILNAIRDLASDYQWMKFRIALRSDVYYLVRTSDESTDKFERYVVWLKWTNHEILVMLAKRVATYFSLDLDQEKLDKYRQKDITNTVLSQVIDPIFTAGRGHWADRPVHNVLLSLTRSRPRDLLKLFHGAAKNAKINSNQKISSFDLESTFSAYSQARLQDIINEFRTEMPNIEQFLLNMRPTKAQRKAAENYLFSTDALSKKINGILNNVPVRFTNGRPVSARSLIQFLYKIEFITARRESEDFIERVSFDENRFLASDFVEFGYKWEIHPAYRWALQPQDVNDVLHSLRENVEKYG
jgi:hypothetical protein